MKPNTSALKFLRDQYHIILRRMQAADWMAKHLPMGMPAMMLAAGLGVAGAEAAQADDTWTGGAGTGNWSDSNNWADHTAPNPAGMGILTFTGDTQTNLTNDLSNAMVARLVFDSNAAAFTLTGQQITLGQSIFNTSGKLQTIGFDIKITQYPNQNGHNLFVLNDVILGGTISDAVTGDAAGIDKNGTGTLTLSGANTYTGKTDIFSGTVVVAEMADHGQASNLGSDGPIILHSATLKYIGAGDSSDRRITIAGNGNKPDKTPVAAVIDASGTGALKLTNAASIAFNGQPGPRSLTLTGANTDDNTFGMGIADHVNKTGVTTGATSLNKDGAGTWVLTGNSTYTGDTAVKDGILRLGGASSLGQDGAYAGMISGSGTLDYASGASQEFSGPLGGIQLAVSGPGALTLSGSADLSRLSQTGGTLIVARNTSVRTAFMNQTGGTLRLDVTAPGTPVTVTSDAQFGGGVDIANTGQLAGPFRKVLIDVAGAAAGTFDKQEGQVVGSRGDFNYVTSYALGDGNDFGVKSVVRPDGSLGDTAGDLMPIARGAGLFQAIDIQDHLDRHHLLGNFEDRTSQASVTGRSRATALAGDLGDLDFSKDNGHALYGTFTHHAFNHDTGVDGTSNRLTLGHDWWMNRDTVVGVRLTAGMGEWTHGADSGDVNDYRLSLFCQYALRNNLFMDVGGGFGYLDLETRRGAQTASPKGWDTFGFTRLTWRALDDQKDGTISRLSPYAGLRGTHTRIGDYTESGPTPFHVGKQTGTLGQAFIGVNWTQWFDLEQGGTTAWGYHLRAEGFLGVIDANDQPRLSVVGAGETPVLARAAEADGYGGRLNPGVDFRTEGWTLSLDGSVGQAEHSRDWYGGLSLMKWW